MNSAPSAKHSRDHNKASVIALNPKRCSLTAVKVDNAVLRLGARWRKEKLLNKPEGDSD